MKVGIIASDFPPEISGAGHLYYELSQDLVSRGHEVTVLTHMPRRKLGEQGESVLEKYNKHLMMKENMDGIRVMRVAVPKLPLNNPIAKGISQILVAFSQWVGSFLSFNSEVVLCYSPPLPCGLSASFIAHQIGVPFVLNVQDIFPQYAIDVGLMRDRTLIKAFEWLERYLYEHADHIIVHSQGNKDYLIQRRGIAQDRISVAYNWGDIDRITPGYKYNGFRKEHQLGNRFVVSYAGTIGWAQNVNTIIEAAAVLQKHKDILFLLVGDGPLCQELKEKCESLGLDNAKFLPFQPRDKYPSVLQASDVSVISLSPKLSTPVVPGKLMDIMAAGVPVAGCVPLSGDASRIVNEAQCGFCVESDDVNGFADIVLKLYNDRDTAEKFGRNGRRYAEKCLSRKLCTSKYEEILKKVVEKQVLEDILKKSW